MPGPLAGNIGAMEAPLIRYLAAAAFAVALLHTFGAKALERLGRRYPRHAGLWHLLGEVEVVFGFWAALLLGGIALLLGPEQAIGYAESREYTEPLFVFVIMVVAASRPVLQVVGGLVGLAARRLPVPMPVAQLWLGLALVPLLGSLVTEPAAMTIAALMLAPLVFRPEVPEAPKYLGLGVLFVNVSIGGTLTSFAAPPVLMVAGAWQWDSLFMASTFGGRASVAVLVNATLATLVLRRHAAAAPADTAPPVPGWVSLVHLAFLAAVVALAHHPVMFMGLFLLFLGYLALRRTTADPRHQARRAAVVALVAVLDIPLVNRSVEWWENRTLHQQSTLAELKIQDLTLFTLMLGFVVFGLVGAWLLLHRFRVGWLEQAAAEHGVAMAIAERHAELDMPDVDAAVGDAGDGP